jgi:hypothetical protein
MPTDQRPFFTLFVCLQIEQQRFAVEADAVQLLPVCWAGARSEGSNCGAVIAETLGTTCAVSGLARCERVVTLAETHGNSADERYCAW